MAFADVFRKGYISVAFDSDIVIVVKDDEFAEFKRARKRRRFVLDTFLHTTVAAKRDSVVVDDGESFLIEFICEIIFRNRHTYCVGDTLS